MRGGTSKGVFFKLTDLPLAAQQPGPVRDAILLRVIGSPDPYGKQIDGMGAATSSTSKTVILAKSSKPDHDVDYLFGQVAIDRALPADAIAVVSLEQVAPVFLNIPGKGVLFEEELAKTGAADKTQIYGEIGLEYGNQAAHGVLRGLFS